MNISAQISYPEDVKRVLEKATNNRPELEQSLDYFYKLGDTLKVKAINFLISNMDIHSSVWYYWVDTITGNRVTFNELDYPDLPTAEKAFEALDKSVLGLKALRFEYNDIDSIKASMLIAHMECAFEVWQLPWAKNISFEDFCAYILPYRIDAEPLQNWLPVYRQKFAWIRDSAMNHNIREVVMLTAKTAMESFNKLPEFTRWKEPADCLGPLQLLYRHKDLCGYLADFSTFILRSQGFCAAKLVVPAWATSGNSHHFNFTFDEAGAGLFF